MMSRPIDGSRRVWQGGFTLIELMIVVAVIAILAAIAIPSYQFAVIKSRRSVAQGCLTEAAQFMERFYTANLRYDQDTDGVAVALPACAEASSMVGHYTISNPPTATQSTYTVTVTPEGAQASKEQNCGTMTINQAGQKTASITGDRCWK